MSTDFTQSNEKVSNEYNEYDSAYLSGSETSGERLKTNANDTNENYVYSVMPLSTEMHYNPDSSDQLEEEKENLQDEIRNLNKDKLMYEKRNKDLQLDYDNLREKHNGNVNLENQLDDLNKQNALLEDEASNYQSALGVATNFQLSDDDQNHGVKLNNTISELNDNIKKYITNLKQDIVVNIEEVKKLLLLYKCSTKITSQKKDRLIIQAVLHRHVIETIFSYALHYFGQTEKHEADIVRNETLLSELLAHTSKCRTGDDEITRVGPTKLRQQIYSILSNRGFANVIDNKGEHEHPFISSRKEDLNKVMNQLRTIKDNGKKNNSENLAATIIREVVKLFWFRLKVQEPVAEYFWIPNNTKVDQTIMKANQPENDDDVDTYVDLCYFPQIGKDLDTKDPKTYTLANF
ncbi:6258_t:CDS:2 [Rhizophagus irregularis]|nr:6258_t:CDS:2 [Rhizophagus irregularis]